MAEVKREHTDAARAVLKRQFGNWTEDVPLVAQALADLEATVEARVRRELGLTTAEGYAIAPPETLAEAWDDGYKVGKCDGTCDAKGYARRIGDKNPHRDAVEQALSVPEPAASEREGVPGIITHDEAYEAVRHLWDAPSKDLCLKLGSYIKQRIAAEAGKAQAEGTVLEGDELVRRLTLALRLADSRYPETGGSTRHYVRECLVDVLEKQGLRVVALPSPPEEGE